MKTKFKTQTETNYKMNIAGKERVIPEIIFTILPGSENLSISVKEFRKVSQVVSNEALSPQNLLNYQEVEFLRNFYKLKIEEIAKHLSLPESTVAVWRKKEGDLNQSLSDSLKTLFKSKITASV